MTQTHHSKVLIIGAGPAGYTAAIYTARAGLEPIMVAGSQPGGQLTITTEVENYPGFVDAIQGPWLVEQMSGQAAKMGTKIIYDNIAEVDFTAHPFRAIGDSGDVFTADSVIIATGAQARWLGLESETRLRGFGVSGCATCDGFFFRGKEIVVVGGGNSAMEEALYLTRHASKVTIIHRRHEFRGEQILKQRVAANPKIAIIWDSVVEEIIGAGEPVAKVVSVRLRDVNTSVESVFNTSGVFIAIGHSPATAVFKGKIEMDTEGYIVTHPNSTLTSVAGVFAAGDVQDKVYRQAVTAAGMGCMAALDAERYLATHAG